jgi:hypothetical protein
MKTKILQAAIFAASFAVILVCMLEYTDCLTK